LVGSSNLTSAVAGRGEALTSAISHANTAFKSISSQNVALERSLEELPPVMRQANTTFVNLRAALDDVEPLINTAKPATKNLAPFLAELRPVLDKFIPLTRNLGLAFNRPGPHNDTTSLLQEIPAVQQRASSAFPHAEAAIAAFQPQLNFARSYTPDLFNALGHIGAATGAYDGNGHYVRASLSGLNLFKYDSGKLAPITRGEQLNGFTSTSTPRRCPGGATQPAADASNPYINPPHGGSSVNPSECNPSQGTGG
jgi:phospholipid/cholesterol/gamma-HCH transport system substrate-binding protein